jgi:glycosyltransferase involved in cell wall biosynthesis
VTPEPAVAEPAGNHRPRVHPCSDEPAPLRVLHFISYPFRMAGANRSLFELISNYPPSVQPTVVIAAEGPVVDFYRRAGIPVEVQAVGKRLSRVGGAALRWSPLGIAQAVCLELAPLWARLAKMVRDKRIDLVHANDARGTLMIGPVARLLGRPLVAHMRGERSFDGPAWEAYERLPHRIVTVSRSIQDRLGATGRKKAVAIYNGTRDVAGQRTPSAKAPENGQEKQGGDLTVAAFASVVPFKGCHHLMDALALLNARGWRDKITVLWIGDAPPEHRRYQDWLERKRLALGLENFRLLGWQPDPFPYYRSVDLTVLPSVSEERLQLDDGSIEVRGAEGLPRTHLEAMCHALPVVGTRIAGVPELVADGETGFVVPPSDPAALADAIERLARDPALRRRLGGAGRERILTQFSTATYVERMVALYQELCLR